MSWLELAQACDDAAAAELFRTAHEAQGKLYWYPGGGHDFTPLLLLQPGNLFTKTLISALQPAVPGSMLLWMTDIRPHNLVPGGKATSAYPALWERYCSSAELVDCTPFSISSDPLTYELLSVAVSRPDSTETFYVVRAVGDGVEQMQTFSRFGLPIGWLALIKAGGFAGELIKRIPAELKLSHNHALWPEAFIGDRDWNRDTVLSDYRRLHGGGVKGWGFTDPGCASIWPRTDLFDQYREALPLGERTATSAGFPFENGQAA